MKLPKQLRPAEVVSGTAGERGKLLPAMIGGAAGVQESPAADAPSIVYTVGTLGYDFRTQVWHDYFVQQVVSGGALTDTALMSYLGEHLTEAQALTWTISVDHTPIYAIQPGPPFAREIYAWLVRFLSAATAESPGVMISVPGMVVGSITLVSGDAVPLLRPVLQGMFRWSDMETIDEQPVVLGQSPDTIAQDVGGFANRIWRKIRNRGALPTERAFNYVATRAYQEARAILRDGDLEIDTVTSRPSPIGRPASNCWDVQLVLFNPTRLVDQPKIVYQYTVDVSNVLPVLVVPPNRWLRS